ncbi:MAG TPA: hypothetical protein VFZ58_01865 [Candidatus Saccharimonadales bacterium]
MKKMFFATLVVTAIASVSAFYLFSEPIDPISVAVAVAIIVPQLVAIWAFLTSLKAFKQELKLAYYILTAGILLFSINQLQIFVLVLTTIDPIVFSWLFSGITLTGALLMYLSMHRFNRLLELQARMWGSFLSMAALAIVLAIASSFIPHSELGFEEWVIDGIFGMYVAAGTLAAGAALLAWRIKERLSINYKSAMGWLAAGLAMLAFACFHETFVKLLPLFEQESLFWYISYSISLWPLVAVALLLLAASLSFKKISKDFEALPENANYIDVVTYVASLISDPKAIDISLDKVRQITATKNASELTPSEQSTLLDVYKKLEAYVTTEEPLLKITRESLRARLPEGFRRQLEA